MKDFFAKTLSLIFPEQKRIDVTCSMYRYCTSITCTCVKCGVDCVGTFKNDVRSKRLSMITVASVEAFVFS